MDNTLELITKGYKRFPNVRVDADHSKLYPARLIPVFYRIATKHYVTNSINQSEYEFLIAYNTWSVEKLMQLAWFNGEFYKYKSHSYENYNLRRKYGQKRVKRIRTANDYWLK